MNAIETFKSANNNFMCRWSYDDLSRNNDGMLAINRIYNGYFIPRFTPKFRVSRNSTFFTIGSCFAREIESALLKSSVKVSSRLFDIQNEGLFPIRKGIKSIFDFFNRYNAPSISREVKNIAGVLDLSKSNNLIYEVTPDMFDDLHYTAAVESSNVETLLSRRYWLRERLSAAYEKSDVVIITLGLSEAWQDSRTNEYLNAISHPNILKRNSDHLSIKTIGFSEAFVSVKDAVDILISDGKKIVLTVSPVPLQVTFIDRDIVISNTEAKSTLRTICTELSRNEECVDYFPSFEMVHFTDKEKAWEPDGRHVSVEMISRITSLALGAYLEE